MTTTRPNPKLEVTNIIINKVYMWVDPLTLQYNLNITPSYRHTRQIHFSKMMQEIETQLRKPTCDMRNEKFNGNIDHQNSSLVLSEGETDRDKFIEALNRIINKFGL